MSRDSKTIFIFAGFSFWLNKNYWWKRTFQGFMDRRYSQTVGRSELRSPNNKKFFDPWPSCGSPAPIVLKIFSNELIWSWMSSLIESNLQSEPLTISYRPKFWTGWFVDEWEIKPRIIGDKISSLHFHFDSRPKSESFCISTKCFSTLFLLTSISKLLNSDWSVSITWLSKIESIALRHRRLDFAFT